MYKGEKIGEVRDGKWMTWTDNACPYGAIQSVRVVRGAIEGKIDVYLVYDMGYVIKSWDEFPNVFFVVWSDRCWKPVPMTVSEINTFIDLPVGWDIPF